MQCCCLQPGSILNNVLRTARMDLCPHAGDSSASAASVALSVPGEAASVTDHNDSPASSISPPTLADHMEVGGEPSGVFCGIYVVGSRPLSAAEADLRYQLFQQHMYLIRGVSVEGLAVPEVDRAEALAFGLIVAGQATWAQLLRLVQMLPCDRNMRWRQEHANMNPSPRRFTTGAWNHGPQAGVMRNLDLFPWSSRALAGILATWDEDLCFSTCTFSLNTLADAHRDSFNHAQSTNLALPCSQWEGGGIFIEDTQGCTRLQLNGPAGHVLSLREPLAFPPRALHATMPWAGTRLVLIAFHLGQSRNLSDEHVQRLLSSGFRPSFR